MRFQILPAFLALVAASAAFAGPRVTTELVTKLARKYDFGDDRSRFQVVAKYSPGIEGFRPADGVELAKVFKYDSWKTKMAKELVDLLPASLTTEDVRTWARLTPFGEDKDRFGLVARMIPKLPPLGPVELTALTEVFKYDSWKTKLLFDSERFLRPQCETAEIVALIRTVPFGEDRTRWQAMEMLIRRWRVPAPAALIQALEVFKYDSWKQKAVVQLSLGWYTSGLTTKQVAALVRVVPFGEDQDRFGFLMRLLPQVRGFGMAELDALEQVFKYDSWKQKFMEEALPYMDL